MKDNFEVDPQTGERTLTIKWQDPATYQSTLASLTGTEFLQALQSGEVPAYPMNRLIGIEVTEVQAGIVRIALEPTEVHTNPVGAAQGGLAATLLDTAIGYALTSVLPAGMGCTTVEMNVHYIRPVFPDRGPLFCEGRVVYKGKQIATVESRLFDREDKLFAQASATCVILPNPTA